MTTSLEASKVTKVLTPEFRVSFPFIFRKQKQDDGSENWGVVMIFDRDTDFTQLKALIQNAREEEFGNRIPDNHKSPLRKGETYDLEKRPEYKGKVIASAKSWNAQPGLIDLQNNKEEIIDASEFYPGCYARATVTAFCYDRKGNRGVSLCLQNLIKTRDGEPLVSRATPQDDFASITPGSSGSGDNSDLFDDDIDL